MEYQIKVKNEILKFNKLTELIEFCERSQVLQNLIKYNNNQNEITNKRNIK